MFLIREYRHINWTLFFSIWVALHFPYNSWGSIKKWNDFTQFYFIYFISIEQGNKEPGAPNTGDKLFKDEELVALIDPILGMDDVNKDGFIDYPEFIQAQQKAAASGQQ